MQEIRVIDSHTGGEPTRVVISGGPDLGDGPLYQRRELFSKRFDYFRRAVVLEPRGWDAMVGGLLVEPSAPDCSAGVIFFNNVGFLGMCGHGTIGLVATLAHLGRIQPGVHRIDTPVGVVTASLHDSGDVSVRNVASYRFRKDVSLELVELGRVAGDVAWGGNWFFLCDSPVPVPIVPRLRTIHLLTEVADTIRKGLSRSGIAGAEGAEIDHVELFEPSGGRNFVLCPGRQYDRSPCGTGLSAKLACLYEDGKLKAGEVWRQESITGSFFDGSVEIDDGKIIPTITGRAYIVAESTLLLDPSDPFVHGIASDA